MMAGVRCYRVGPFHDLESATLQVASQMLSRDSRHQADGVAERFAALEAQGECQRFDDLLGRGGAKVGLVGHASPRT
jgi:hypothetical protein